MSSPTSGWASNCANNNNNAGNARFLFQGRLGNIKESLVSRIQGSRLSYFFTSRSNNARPPDFYKLLNIPRDANEAEIHRAYRKMALLKHADKGGENACMQELNEAKRILLDSILRQAYDEGGIAGVRAVEQRKSDKYILATIPDIMCRERFGNELGEKYFEMVEAVNLARMREEHCLPKDLTNFLRIRGYGFLVRAIEAALARNFVCIQCNRTIVDGVLGLCYCEQEAPHCLMACCGEERRVLREEESVGWTEVFCHGIRGIGNKFRYMTACVAAPLILFGCIVRALEKYSEENDQFNAIRISDN